MDMNETQVEMEFMRHIRLCSGLGEEKMLQMVTLFFIMDKGRDAAGLPPKPENYAHKIVRKTSRRK